MFSMSAHVTGGASSVPLSRDHSRQSFHQLMRQVIKSGSWLLTMIETETAREGFQQWPKLRVFIRMCSIRFLSWQADTPYGGQLLMATIFRRWTHLGNTLPFLCCKSS